MAKLNKDVLFIILEDLVSDKNWNKSSLLTRIEKKSLHSCLFVNRLWCETTIPILWSNPWKFVVNNKKLFNVIISFLSKESQNFISSQGINLINLFEKPLFDYISYCKYLTYQNIEICINEIQFDKDYQSHIIIQEIYRLMINKCLLKFLDLGNVENHLKFPIYHFTGSNLSLETLCYLYCDSSIDSAFFYGLSYVCKSLQKIHVTSCPDDNLGLARLIEVQKNLKCFICSINSDDEIYDPKHKQIGNALIKQSNSLIHFKLIYGEMFFFPLNILSNFINLQKLKLTYFYVENDYQLENQLESSSFPKLEVFNIGVITLNIAIKIIAKTAGYLSNVILGYTIYEEEFSGLYIRTIYEHCPNIKTLSLGITDNDYIEFENLLKKCKLERMIIEGSFRKNSYAKLLFNILSRSAPNTLREIRFFNDWTIISSDLELFFENWRGRKPIYLYFFVSDDEYNEFIEGPLEILIKYKEEGIVKNYQYGDNVQEFYFSW